MCPQDKLNIQEEYDNARCQAESIRLDCSGNSLIPWNLFMQQRGKLPDPKAVVDKYDLLAIHTSQVMQDDEQLVNYNFHNRVMQHFIGF